jgi:hypothetical protein
MMKRTSIEKQFVKLSYAKNVTPLLKNKKVDFALVFAVNVCQLNNVLKELLPALHDNSKLWVAYPKETSKIVSDLNRDCSWEILTRNSYEGVSLVALDHVWSAMRFKKSEALVNANARAKIVVEKVAEIKTEIKDNGSFEKRLVMPPLELEKVFIKHKKVKEFFTSLSVTNQKEYVTWIEEAKKEETRQRRLEVVVEKLMAGKKNPSEK